MNSDDILDVIGCTEDKFVKDAKNKIIRFPAWAKALTAACIILIIGIGFFRNLGMGGSAGGGADHDLVYMSYEGPRLPLTLSEENDNITAERNINFDFSPYMPYKESFDDGTGEIYTYTHYDSKAIVRDRYILTNTTNEDITVKAYYPFMGTISQSESFPEIFVDGTVVEASINAGPYIGDFMGVWGGENQEYGSENLRPLGSFEGVEQRLSDGTYQNSAFDDFPSLDIPVVVYKMHDYVYTTNEDAGNPTLQMSFYIDYDKTSILTYGFNGGTRNTETGYSAHHNGAIEYRPNADPRFQHPQDAYLVVVGDDIGEYTIQGYEDGGCDKGEEVDDLGCTITRYETTLGKFLYGIIKEDQTDIDTDLLLSLVAELITSHGPLGENVSRYDWGDLDIIIAEAKNHGRVIYFEFDVTIPAGGTVTVSAIMPVSASIDYVGDDKGRDGYDMATVLGSNLNFTSQTASISNYEEIEILAQNFGFDLLIGNDSVELDLNTPHYWMEIRKKIEE
ncbi:MAG: hypothetical protein IJO77_03365 [Oscillospiraceae bacterium]|nr:hypothetical protein [Oscillospiraceae bacterium]